jgi:hypothetical protein
MSITHKAYLFNHRAFAVGLAGILYESLQRDDVHSLRTFIQRHLAELTEFGTEKPPDENWEKARQDEGGRPIVQWYADLALTKYYDFTDNLGLDYGFDALHAYLRMVPELRAYADELICGHLFGLKGRRFDPGGMGTGLLSEEDVKRLHELLEGTNWPPILDPQSTMWADCLYKPESAEDVGESLARLLDLYRVAAETNTGLLLVDFNDRGVGEL